MELGCLGHPQPAKRKMRKGIGWKIPEVCFQRLGQPLIGKPKLPANIHWAHSSTQSIVVCHLSLEEPFGFAILFSFTESLLDISIECDFATSPAVLG
jgi:hypothetical protein